MQKLPIEIELPDSFFAQETRCGYVVSEKAKRIWAVELDLLCKFDEVCRRHDIKYQLGYGTLLGAVRHKGFIPWDDDVDVWMTRAEFDRLTEVANEFSSPYFLQTPLSDRRFLVLGARLRNSMTTGIVASMSAPEYNCGIYLDIFPMDGYIESSILLFLQLTEKQIISKCMEIYQFVDEIKVPRSFLYRSMQPFVRLIPYKVWNRWFDLVTARYTGVSHRLSYVNGMVWRNRRRYWMSECEMNEVIDGDFEGHNFPITSHYVEVLTRIYGNYMRFPPKKVRGRHHSGTVLFDPDRPYGDFFLGLKNAKCKD